MKAMIKKYIIFLMLISFLSSCGSNQNESEKKNDEKTEVTERDKQSLKDDKDNIDQAEDEKIDPQFKAFLSKFQKRSLPYELNPMGNEKYDKISLEEQSRFLSKAEKLSKKDFEDMADYTDFYFVSNPVNTGKFHALVYGRFEMGSTYYFLCTFNHKGALISNIDFAAYELMGAGPQAGQEFNTNGSIDNVLEITVKSDEETRNYKIQDDGTIVKL